MTPAYLAGLLLQPPAIGALLLYGLWVAGGVKGAGQGRVRRQPAWRTAAFIAGLVTLVAPELLGQAAQDLFWVHMDQHLLLLTVAPPLLLLGAPWTQALRGLPLGFRRVVARALFRGRARTALLGTWHLLRSPRPVVAIFLANLWAWHLVAFYQLTLDNGLIHHLEHALLFLTGMALWALLVDSPPLLAGLAQGARVVVATVAMLGCWAMSVVLAFAPGAFYPGYYGLASRPGGFSALTDQQLGAGMMWGPGSIPLGIVVFTALAAWLNAQSEPVAAGGAADG